ncbi:hypothetical protein ACHAXS_003708 [Conticribra weissflogii]
MKSYCGGSVANDKDDGVFAATASSPSTVDVDVDWTSPWPLLEVQFFTLHNWMAHLSNPMPSIILLRLRRLNERRGCQCGIAAPRSAQIITIRSWHQIMSITPIFRSQSYFDDQVKMYEVQFSLQGEMRVPPSNLCELYCMHTSRWKTCKFGIVAHDFTMSMMFRKYSNSSSILKAWITVSDDDDEVDNTGWLSRKEFRRLLNLNELRSALVVDTDVTLTLMYDENSQTIRSNKSDPALEASSSKALFTSRVTLHAKQPASNARPTSVPAYIGSSLRKSHNSYQLSSISNLLTGSCRENVSLIQGPPGTGKSSTIVGLVTALLSGKAPLPGQRQSGCLIHAGKTMGVSLSEPLARNRPARNRRLCRKWKSSCTRSTWIVRRTMRHRGFGMWMDPRRKQTTVRVGNLPNPGITKARNGGGSSDMTEYDLKSSQVVGLTREFSLFALPLPQC